MREIIKSFKSVYLKYFLFVNLVNWCKDEKLSIIRFISYSFMGILSLYL